MKARQLAGETPVTSFGQGGRSCGGSGGVRAGLELFKQDSTRQLEVPIQILEQLVALLF